MAKKASKKEVAKIAPGGAPRLKPAQIKAAVEAVKAGSSYASVGRKFGVSDGAIAYHCKAAGISVQK